VTADAGQLPDGCGIVFATKGPQLPDCVRDVHAGLRSAGRDAAWVAGVQNGVVKDDVLAAEFGADRLVRMVSTLNARVEAPSSVVVSAWGNTYVGSGPLRAALSAARVPVTGLSRGDGATVTWMKCVNAAGVFGVTALTRLPTTAAFSRPELVRAYLDLIADAAAVARAGGVDPTDYDGLPMLSRLADPAAAVIEMVTASRAAPAGPTSYSSMAQDVLAGRPTEVDEVLGDLVTRAEAAGIAVPHLQLAYRLIAGQSAAVPSDRPPSNTTAAPVMKEHSGETR
jgi:2-dehydropantoate 2-reductase